MAATALGHFAVASMGALIAIDAAAAAATAAAVADFGTDTVGRTFVHLFEWSWADVARECEDFLGPKGFAAVQVSPPNEHMSGDPWWTRYQPVTYNLTSRSGDEKAFVDMVQRCKKAGVGIYVDAVTNHIATGSGVGVGGSRYGDRSTPIYSPEDMHHNNGDVHHNCAVNNFQDQFNVQSCDLVALPDLCTGCDKVQALVAGYLSRLAELGVAGIRIDAAKHQESGELGRLLSRVGGPRMYTFQEVIQGAGEAVKPEMYFSLGQVTEFQYARKLAPNFVDDGKLQYLGNFGEAWDLMPSASAVVFLDNHDTQRGEARLTYKQGALYQLANVFMLAHPYGYPKVMSSFFFDGHDQGPPPSPVHSDGAVHCGSGKPWVCEHRWGPIANMVAWRTAAGGAPVQEFQALGGDAIAFCRGAAACVALNRGGSVWEARLKFNVPPGRYCDVFQSDDSASCPKVEVAGDGSATLRVPPLGAVAVHVGALAQPSAVIAGPTSGARRNGFLIFV